MTKRNRRRCSVVRHRVDDGIVIRITGACSKQGAVMVRSMIRGYLAAEPNFIVCLVRDVGFEHIDDLIDICSDFIGTEKPLYLIAPKPEVRAAFDTLSCETGCCVCETLEDALALIRKDAA